MTIYLIARVQAKAEHRAEVESELRRMVAASRAEPGCLRYDLFADQDGGAGFSLVEAYRDVAAVEAHRGSAHYQAYRGRTGDWLAAPTEVQVLSGVDVAPFA
jgi:quinol monooxygenase YgiN